MNINQHNYEEFFILYWDDELSAEQKKIVEGFVVENKDLQEDFRLFGESHFTPDMNLQFEEKDLLLNTENSTINFSNYPEQLLSFIDDELSPDQKKTFESFAEKHPTVKQELLLLQKTKLQPDLNIVFPDKSSLYKREEKVRIINISWLRVAVAAALILIAGFVTIQVLNNNSDGGTPELVSAEPSINPPVSQPVIDQQQKPEIANVENTITTKPAITKTTIKKESQILPKENLIAENIVSANSENKNNLPKEKTTAEQLLIAQNSTTNPTVETVTKEKINNNTAAVTKQNTKKDLFENSTVTDRHTPSYAKYEVSDELKKDVDNGGLKGLLRKATRLFERRTNIQTTSENDKLLVGVFAVSLK